MVSKDIINLEVTRLRDILRTRVTEILCLGEDLSWQIKLNSNMKC